MNLNYLFFSMDFSRIVWDNESVTDQIKKGAYL